MKLKREIIIISLIIAVLFTISSVCAVDSEIQAISTHNSTDELVSTANDNNLKMNDANEILAETDDGSFAALNTKISGATAGSTVYLENDYEYSSSDTITAGIFIDKNLIIDGQGHKIDAKQKSRIFDCSPYDVVDVTLKNIIFLNGKADYGGALYWYPDGGESNIINCTFIGNSASGSYGGGAVINEQDGISNIINCTFIDNHDTNCALYLSSTKVINSIFLNNGEKTLYGPNIEADYNWFGNTIDNYNTVPSVTTSSAVNNWYVLNMTINGANNIATLDLNNLYDRSEINPCDTYALPSITFNVGGINATLNKETITLDNNGKASFRFTVTEGTGKLTASSNGVSISKDVVNMADEGTMAALNTKITDAISNGESEVKLYNDYVYGDSEPIVTNTITTANPNGIGITTDFTIDGQGFTIDGNNKGGRIIYLRDASKNLILKNINFVNCKDQYGSAVYVTCNNLEIINCTFTEGTATANPGAGIYASVYGNYNIKNSNFTNNKITASNKKGGAITLFTNSGTTGEIVNCSFMNNQVNDYGGALYITSNNGVGGDTGSISGCIFKGNVASKGSSLYLYSPGSYTLTNSILLDEGNIIFSNNAFNIDNNWWGSTVDDYSTLQVKAYYGNDLYIPVDKWLYLDVVIDNENAVATVSLNNLNDGTVYENYALPEITLNVQATNADINTNKITLDENGQATINYEMTDKTGTLTVSYADIHVTKEIKLFVQDSFTSLKNQIEESQETTVALHQNYNYNSSFDQDLANGIEISKSIIIDGNGYTIDAKGLKNIFYFDDNTNSKDLTLKNIIFTNATRANGAAVYFKGNKIEIINCTFINNKANSQGDAVYIADASSNENKITESRFMNNSGENSVVYINLESANARLTLSNSIFLSNDATFDVKGTGDVIVDYNWWGTTTEDYTTNSPKVEGATLNNWYVLNFTADIDTNIATVSLNNLYDGNDLTVYENYALPVIKFNVKGTGVIPDVDTIILSDGSSTFGFTLDVPDSSLTLGYGDIWQTTTEIHYVIVDDGSFKALYDLIRLTPENGVLYLTKNYTYSETDTITPGIPITKTITINGNDYTINANGKSGIFVIYSDNIAFNDIIFTNGISKNGGAIYSTVDYKYLNIDNCTFINNTATETDGGAIWSGSYYFGSVTNSKFINNTAVEDGGAIFTYSYNSYATIDGCTFINNTAPLSSAIYAWVCKIQNSVFLNNSGNMIRGKYDYYKQINYNWFGNTVENYTIQPTIESSIIGWLYLDIKFYEDFAIVSLNNLYTKSSDSSSVYTNYNLPEITLNINSTTLNLNTDKITLDSTGKAIVPYTKIADDAKLTVSNDYVSLTKDALVGDFDVLQELIDTTVGDTIELNRNYTFIEGVDTLVNGISITRDITIDGKGYTIDGSNLARIFSITTNGVTLKNINFVNGTASHGGAIYNSGGSGFKLINCTFENNLANKEHGGAIYTYSTGENDFINCTFIGNKATATSKNGGAIYIYEYSGQNNFIGCTFINNTAKFYGGAIATGEGKAITNIDKSVFVTNSASSYSSIYIYGTSSAEFYLKNSIIFNKGFTTDQSVQVYVYYTLRAGDVNNNWWMHTTDNDDYKKNMYIHYSGGGLTVTKWLFLDMNCEDEIATISINNLYDSSTQTYSTYDGELPQITFDLSGVNVKSEDNTKLNKNGVGEAAFDITAQTGSITATYNSVSITKSVVVEDSFTVLQSKINRAPEGSELVLYHDYNYDAIKDTGLTDGIEIDKDLTIDGQGVTIDAKNAARIFKIDDNSKNIIFKNIKFTNARAADGAAVYANCNGIEVINCTFEDNEASNNGDALYVIANGCDITESAFVNNLGINSALYLASDLQDAPFNMDNSIVVNNAGANIVKDDKISLTANNNWWGNTVDNTADLSGGLAQNWYLLDMSVDNAKSIATVLLNNLWDGSAYSPCETYALPTISADIQTNAYASARKDKVNIGKDGDTVGYIVTDETNAGSITVSYNGVSLTREISYNEESDYSFKALKKIIDAASDNDIIELVHDYEYVIDYDDITVGIDIVQNNLTINGNGYTIDAKGKTRIFNVGDSSSDAASNVTIKNTTFINGKISANGGAIRWYGDNGNLTNCTFRNNTAANYYGGALYWDSSFSNIINCTFEENSAGTNSGGAIYIQTNNVDIFNLTFQENKASKGGSLYINSNNVTIVKSTFAKSSQGSSGGAIYIALPSNAYITAGNNITIINSTFSNNTVTSQGGAIYIAVGNGGENIAIINSSFSNNHADDSGGAIYWADGKNRQIINSTFKNNSANKGGGAIYWSKTQIDSGKIFNSTFIRNYVITTANSDIYGGAININSGSLTINKTDFIDNYLNGKSNAKGGAIYYSSSDNLAIIDSNFIGNGANSGVGTTATNKYAYGGAIYFSGGNINITRSNFNRNYVDSPNSYTYGCIIDWENGNGEISNSTFINNHGKTSNNGIFGRGSSNANITNCIFLNNTYGDNNYLKHASITAGNFNFTYCWFGNTPNDNTGDQGIINNNYLFVYNRLTLNVKHDEYMVVGEDRNIKFVYTYSVQYIENGNINNRDELYDASKLPKINLTLSTVNGELNKYTAFIGENLLFKGNEIGSASVTGRVYDSSVTGSFDVKRPTKIIVNETFNSFVGDFKLFDASVVCSDGSELPYGVTYSWSYNHNGSNEEVAIYNDGFTGWKSGTYLVTITAGFDSTSDYSNSSINVTIIVSQIDKEIIVDGPNEITYGNENIDMEVSLDITDETYRDKLTYDSQDPNILTVTNNGLMTAVNAGKTNITITYAGSDKYKATSKKVEITVKKAGSDVTVPDKEFVYGSDVIITVTTFNSTSVSAVVLDEEGNVVSGAVVTTAGNDITVTGLNVGNYTLNVTTNDISNNHYSVTRSATLNITKAGSDVSVPVSSNVVYGSSVDVDVVIPDNGNASSVTAKLYLGDVEVLGVVSVSGFKVTVDASDLDVDTYTLKVTTVTDDNHASVTKDGSVVVGKAGSDVSVPVSSSVVYGSSVTVVVSDLVNASGVTASLFKGTDKVKDLVVNDGVNVVVDASGVDVGDYTLKVTTIPIDSNHDSVTKEAGVTVNPAGSDVNVPVSSSVVYGSSVGVDVVIPDGGNASGVTAKLYLGDSEVPGVVSVSDLKVTVNAETLKVDTYTLKVTTTPIDSNHTSVTKECSIIVNPAGSDVTVPATSNVVYDSGVTVVVSDLVNASGVTASLFKGTDKVKDLVVNDGVNVVVDASGVDVGDYTLKVTTIPIDSNHDSVTKEAGVTVNPAGSDVNVPVSSSVVYGSSVGVDVVIPDNGNASGVTAKLYLGDSEVPGVVSVSGLKVTVNAETLNVGTYTLNVTTIPIDSNHASVTKECSIIVNPAGSDVTVQASESVDYKDSVDIVASGLVNASGITAKLYLGTVEMPNAVSVNDLTVTVDASDLNVGDYTLKITTVTDDNHSPVTRECTVTVNPIDSEVTFLPNKIHFAYEDEGLTIATCTGCTIEQANVAIENHPEAVIKVEGNKITVSNLTEDEYTMKVITTPINSNYKSIETSIKVNVRGISPKMSLQVTNITVGEKEIVFITMGTDAKGIVNITIYQGNKIIESRNITINNRFNKTEFEGLKVGDYLISAYYYGTQNYNEATVPDQFKVHPIYDFEFTGFVNDTVCGNTTNLTVKLSSDATGSIKVGNIIEPVGGAETLIVLPVQNKPGKNNVTVKYIPDENSKYGEKEIIVYYNVAKKSTQITIDDITDVKAGDDVTISATAYPNAEIVLYLDGAKLNSNIVENISAGTHTIIANVAETNEYLSAIANKTFTVTKTDVVLSVIGTPAKVNEKSTITVGITDGVTGTVIVNVDGVDYVLNASDIAPFDVVFDRAGSYDLSARYLGDYKYNSKEVVGNDIEITDKADANIVVSDLPTDIKAGDTFNVTITANSPLKVYVDGVLQTLDVENKLTVSNVAAGIHNITVVADETSDVYGDEKIIPFEVVKNVAEISIDDIIDAKAGDVVNVVVRAYDGADIVVYVDGVKTENVENISAGTHTIVASVDETYEYLSATANKTFTVTKADVVLRVSGTPAKVNEKSTVSVNITDGVSGIVIVNVGGVDYVLNASNVAPFEVVFDRAGSYGLSARYLGDYKYNSKEAVGDDIEITDKANANITVSDLPSDIKAGDSFDVIIAADSPLDVYLDGVLQTIGADNKLTVSNVSAGSHNITVVVDETPDGYADEKVIKFEAVKKVAIIKIDDITAKAGADVNISATAYDGADIVVYVDGVKTKSIENISAGTHTIVASVAETDEYLSATANKTFEVTKSDIKTFIVFAYPYSVTVGEKSEIHVKITDDDVSGGVVVVNVNGTEYSVNITGNEKIFEVVMNRVGVIPLSARYLGNYKYNARDAICENLTVTEKETPEITIQTDSLVVVGDEMIINVTDLPNLVVTIKDVEQTVTAGKIIYTPSTDGAYTIIARTGENLTHYAAEAIASFTVMNKTKESPSIVISEISDAKVGKEFNFTVTAIGGGDAVVKINDVIIPITDGVYKYTPQKSGTFTLTVETPENDKYSKGVNITTFDVGKNEVDLKVSADSVLVGQTATITVDITEEATGIVVIIVNGTEYSLDISGDKKSLDVLMANVGNVTLSAKYLGDDKYNANDADSSVIEVNDKADSIIEINDIDLDIGKPTNPLTAKVNGVDCEDIVFTINGVEGISIDKVEAITYTITATFKGNATHKANTTSKVYVVNKTKSELSIIPPSTISIDEPITFEINSGDRNDVVVYIDGKEYPVINSAVVFTNPTAGTHTIIASLNETDEYLSANANCTFNVDKKDSSIEIESSAGSAIVGETVTIYITPISGADGIVLLNVNGTVFSLTTKDIYYDIVLDKVGTYTINATYVGSDIFKSNNSNVETIEVSEKEISNIDIQIPEVNLVGEDIVINITSDVTPEVYVDGKKQVYKNGKVIVSDLKAGNHTIEVITPETEDHKANSTVKSFNVDKKDSAIEISTSANEAYVGSELTITVSPTSGAVGNVMVNVDGTVYSLTLPDNEVKVVLDKISTYSINATYEGSDIYKPSSSKAVTVEVKDKSVPTVDVQIPEANVAGEDIVINITSDVDPEVYVDGEKQIYKNAKVIVSGLGAGSHVVEVIIPETSTTKASSVVKSLTVSKKQSSIEITEIQGDKRVGSDLKVNLKYEGNNVTVYLDGIELADWDSFTAAAGNHTITAGVTEDGEYLSSTTNVIFEILKNNVDIEVSGTHTTIGEKSTVTVNISKDATGIVVVNVDGTEYSLNISKTSSFDVVFNEPGEYEITATYLGDDRYCSAKATGTIAVYDKKYADIELIIPSETIYACDDVVVYVEYVGDANLTATVDGVLVEIDEGQFTIENIGAGSHTIEVTSPETKQYHEFKAIETFEAVKYSSKITINVPQNIKAGQNVEVEITSYDGADITVTLDGAKQTLSDGKIKFTAAAGDHTIMASVDETDMYLANYTEEPFTVSKLDVAIKVTGTDITQGQATTLTVTTDVDEGVVVVKLNGSEVAVDLAKSKSASVVLDTPGVYELSASYLGTDIYNVAEADKSTITVAEKVTPEVEVDIPEIKAGESETISVSIPNATGSVHVIVDGVEQVIPLDENGNANYTIPEMGAGNHNIVVLYPGDDNNEAKVVSQSVFVPKQSSKADISTPTNVKEGENATVGVEIPGATGSVSVIIDGKETIVLLDKDGKANYTIPEMGAGNHSVIVIYPGDDTHDSTYSAASFSVEGEVITPKLSTEFTNINLTGDLRVQAVLKDSEGNPIAGAVINYSVGGQSGTVKTAEDGSFAITGKNNVVVTLAYAGDDGLEPANISIKIDDVAPAVRLGSKLNVTEGVSIKTYAVDTPAGEIGSLAKFRLTDSNGDPIVNATIKFAYKTVILNRTTDEDGIVFIGINTQVAQEALCALSYVGDERYDATFVAFSFDIQKKPITISAASKSYKASAKTKKYTVTLKTEKCNSFDGKVYLCSGKKVTMKINGKTYSGKINDKGQVTFSLKISKKGKYAAAIKFAGDKTYASASKSVKITIK